MYIEAEALKDVVVPADVAAWMKACGSNHKMLMDSWKEEEYGAYYSDFETLVYCLAYEVQKDKPKQAVVKRLRGRISKVRQAAENLGFEMALKPELNFLK